MFCSMVLHRQDSAQSLLLYDCACEVLVVLVKLYFEVNEERSKLLKSGLSGVLGLLSALASQYMHNGLSRKGATWMTHVFPATVWCVCVSVGLQYRCTHACNRVCEQIKHIPLSFMLMAMA